jgi:hypothetical protein
MDVVGWLASFFGVGSLLTIFFAARSISRRQGTKPVVRKRRSIRADARAVERAEARQDDLKRKVADAGEHSEPSSVEPSVEELDTFIGDR